MTMKLIDRIGRGPMTQDQIIKAFGMWRYDRSEKHVDVRLVPFLDGSIKSHAEEPFGWLKAARASLGFSRSTIAARLGVCRSTYSRIEDAESQGKVSLGTLSRVADALGCELVYALRPKDRITFSEAKWKLLSPRALEKTERRICLSHLRPFALAAAVRILEDDPKFKKLQGWSQRIE